jgi:EAL domain-containing protein (putative c-di-GMP-specific phosphodiesterase class I)
VFAPEMHAAALERLDLESNLRTATRHGGLLLHYQPIYELSTGRIRAAEALVRWMHPQRGLLMPGDFVPFAEQSGLIESIGREVLEVACEQAKAWEIATGEHAPDIAVNLSPRQLQNARLGTEILAVLSNAGLTPDRLILEITENALVTDPEAAARRLGALRELGVRIAVDDFGTGYSSLGYPQHLPIDILKIDKAFVHGMNERSVGSVAEGIVHLAHHLALTPVAEGVESARQAEKLRDCGCELAQGFHLSRPVEAQRLEELLRSANA